LYEALTELRSRPEYAGQIAQVHLVGVSFGGLLCGIAGHCEDRFQRGVVDGAVLAFSPPLDLKQLFQNIANFPYIHDRIHKTYLEDGLRKFTQIGFLKIEENPKQVDFDDYVRIVALPYLQRVYPELKAQFPELPPIRNAADVYAISSMRPFFEELGVPYFYFYAYDDPVLSPDDHFVRILGNCSNPLVDGILLPDGGHLGFDTVTATRYTSRVAHAYFQYWSASGH
jgi:predicted alpha/beta-fold hydrolase